MSTALDRHGTLGNEFWTAVSFSCSNNCKGEQAVESGQSDSYIPQSLILCCNLLLKLQESSCSGRLKRFFPLFQLFRSLEKMISRTLGLKGIKDKTHLEMMKGV